MKKMFAVLLFVSCAGPDQTPSSVDPLKFEAQQALNAVATAILNGELEAFRENYVGPGRDDDRALEILMESQGNGIRSHYEGLPQVTDVRTEPNGEVSVSLFAEKIGLTSPKRVYFERGSDSVLRWMGVHEQTPVGSGNVLRQAIQSCGQYWYGGTNCHFYDIYSNESYQVHAIRAQAQMQNSPVGCNGNPGDFCWQWSALPWYKTINHGDQTTVFLACTVWNGTQCAVNMMAPTYSECTCSTGVSRQSGWCAYIHAWGWDFGWNNGSGGINSLPAIGAWASCPS